MAEVIAKTRGYVGGIVREMGEVFEWPEGIPRGSWVAPAKFGGKGDHDGDGRVGGSVPSAPSIPAGDAQIPENWRKMSAAERRTLAKSVTGEDYSSAKDADAAIELHLEANVTANANVNKLTPTAQEALEAVTGNAPDWVAPAHDGKPEMADE